MHRKENDIDKHFSKDLILISLLAHFIVSRKTLHVFKIMFFFIWFSSYLSAVSLQEDTSGARIILCSCIVLSLTFIPGIINYFEDRKMFSLVHLRLLFTVNPRV